MNENDKRSEDLTGVRSVLSMPWAYRAAQWAIGATELRRTLISEILVAEPGEKIIDLGCGPADILDDLSDVDYLGLDHNADYIAHARARYGTRGRFWDTSAVAVGADIEPDRSLAMAIGVLHHLDDDEALQALEVARSALAPGGRFVSMDPTFAIGQHRIGRWLAERDRGQHVRTPDATVSLVARVFGAPAVEVRHDLLRVPYSHVIVRASTG